MFRYGSVSCIERGAHGRVVAVQSSNLRSNSAQVCARTIEASDRFVRPTFDFEHRSSVMQPCSGPSRRGRLFRRVRPSSVMQPRTRLHLPSCRDDARRQIEHSEVEDHFRVSSLDGTRWEPLRSPDGADARNRNFSAFASPQSTVFSPSSGADVLGKWSTASAPMPNNCRCYYIRGPRNLLINA